MTKAAASVERIIHDDMSWLSEGDAHKLLVSLLTMRRYEAEYRLTRSTLMQTVFFDEFKKFQKIVEDVVGADALKQQLAQQVKAYSDTFAEWIEFTDKVAPPVAVIEFNVKKHDSRRRRDHRLGQGSHQCERRRRSRHRNNGPEPSSPASGLRPC